jgi:hypothetical protein
MINKDKIFDLFSNNQDVKTTPSIKELTEFKIGMFTKLIQNHEIFHKKLSQFLKKENSDYNIEQTKIASSFTVYNKAWFYINQIDLANKKHLKDVLNFKTDPFLMVLNKALQYFEDMEQYERCGKLLQLIKLKSKSEK